MTARHTPGFWRVNNKSRFILNAAGNIIAEAIPYDGDAFLEDEEIEANARLIAMSPIMYNYIQLMANDGNPIAAGIIEQINTQGAKGSEETITTDLYAYQIVEQQGSPEDANFENSFDRLVEANTPEEAHEKAEEKAASWFEDAIAYERETEYRPGENFFHHIFDHGAIYVHVKNFHKTTKQEWLDNAYRLALS